MNVNESNDSLIIYPSLDDLLDSFGFYPINVYNYGIIIPIIAFFGCNLSILNLWIFFKKTFSAPIYWYFRVISIANIIQLAFAIPYGMCFTPTYFPNMDSYSCTIAACAYIAYSNFSLHFVAILEIVILLERIKIMNSFVKKHFKILPEKMILLILFPCLLFNSIFSLAIFPDVGGDFIYNDSNGVEKVNTYWFVNSSPLVQSPIGSICMIVFYFVRDVLTLIVTIILNIVSLYEMSKYFKNRNAIFRRHNLIHAISTHSPIDSTSNTVTLNHNLREKAIAKSQIKLVLIMCLISVVTRVISVLTSIYYLFSIDYIAVLLGALSDLVFVVGPSISFFIYYVFNKDFKKDFFDVLSYFHKKN
jgi:hypothetical protein